MFEINQRSSLLQINVLVFFVLTLMRVLYPPYINMIKSIKKIMNSKTLSSWLVLPPQTILFPNTLSMFKIGEDNWFQNSTCSFGLLTLGAYTFTIKKPCFTGRQTSQGGSVGTFCFSFFFYFWYKNCLKNMEFSLKIWPFFAKIFWENILIYFQHFQVKF